MRYTCVAQLVNNLFSIRNVSLVIIPTALFQQIQNPLVLTFILSLPPLLILISKSFYCFYFYEVETILTEQNMFI